MNDREPNQVGTRTEDYANPPVIEVFAQVKFDPQPGKTEWSEESVQPFLNKLAGGFKKPEKVYRRQIRLQHGEDAELPRVTHYVDELDRVRVFSEDSARCVQIGDDILACNVRKTGQTRPTFGMLMPHFESAWKTYERTFHPTKAEWYALNYVDVIRIPISGKGMELGNYFGFSLEFPAIYGDISSLDFDITFQVANGRLLRVKWSDFAAQKGEISFRVFWTLAERRDCGTAEVLEGLAALHSEMTEYFEAILTEKTRELFRGD